MDDSSASLFTCRTAAIAITCTIVFGAFLYLEGRPAWCESGFGIWSAAWTSCTSQQLFDPYTLSHVLHGVILYWLLAPLSSKLPLSQRLIVAMAIEIGWELLENSAWVIERYRQDTAAFDYSGDSITNSLGDVLATVSGFAFAARFPWKMSIAIFLALEITMLLLARDNLTLNVLMLIHPIEAIKDWQLSGIVHR